MYSMQGRFPHQTQAGPHRRPQVCGLGRAPLSLATHPWTLGFSVVRPFRFLRALFPGPEWIWAHSLEAESWLSKRNLGIATHSPPLTSPDTLTPLLRLSQSRKTKLLLEKVKKDLKTKPRIPVVVLACFRGTSMRGLPHIMRPGSHFPSLSSIPTCTGLFLGSPCPLEAELAAAVPGSEPLTSTLKMSSSHPGKGLIAFHCLDYILCPSISQSLWPGKCSASIGSDLVTCSILALGCSLAQTQELNVWESWFCKGKKGKWMLVA